MKVLIKDSISGAAIFYDAQQKKWVLLVGNNLIQLDDQQSNARLSMLPFMQRSINEICNLIEEYEMQSETLRGHDIKSAFPWSNFISIAFKQGSPHWVREALHWMEVLDTNSQNQFKKELHEIINNKKKYNQKIRQLAFRILKKLDRL